MNVLLVAVAVALGLFWALGLMFWSLGAVIWIVFVLAAAMGLFAWISGGSA